jgi:hypothetical protein
LDARSRKFAYVSDLGNFPSWNSAVREVRPTSSGASGPGSTYAMKRQLPTEAAANQLEILARDQPHEFAIRTTTGPTPFLYRYHFAVENGKTIVPLDPTPSSTDSRQSSRNSHVSRSRTESTTTSRR